MTGNPHRKCTAPGCREITLDLSDGEESDPRDDYQRGYDDGVKDARRQIKHGMIEDTRKDRL